MITIFKQQNRQMKTSFKPQNTLSGKYQVKFNWSKKKRTYSECNSVYIMKTEDISEKQHSS